ncbi:MAG: hypothetical protein ACFFG0_12450 [Candidatus Thorarchaeota archaeon]
MKKFNILSNSSETAQALVLYFKYVLDVEEVVVGVLYNPYGLVETFEKARESDFLVIDGIVDEKPTGFQFAKEMEKRVLLLFYSGELDIECEGPFWLVLPFALERLGDKIKELMEKPAPDVEEYEKLEKRFPELRGRKRHH